MLRADIDVLIAGGGFAGLTLAIALRQALGESFTVAVADPSLGATHADDERASAIVASVRRLFDTLGVCQRVADEAQPILDMVVTDSRLGDAVRPTFLTFAGEIEPGEPFAHMIDNRRLVEALADKARQTGVDLRTAAVTEFTLPSERGPVNASTSGDALRIDGRLSDGSALAAPLLVAADGARSTIRGRAGIATHGWSYGQSAIVINVAHERDHGGRAEEHFLPAGPFAILPLKGRRSSIVWTEEEAAAARIVALPDDLFHDELERRFGLHFGEISVAGPRRAYPLGLTVA